ncbi:MAG: DUF4468 domain-containing protein [Mucilaginibacter sp.]
MKRILFLIICLGITHISSAQKGLLALDEHNKYIYYKVADLPGISGDSLLKNAIGFVKLSYPKNKSIQESKESVVVNDKFLSYSTTAFVKHENGEITYTLKIECKDSKYRYWVTDFAFTPYERNRYGVFVPVNGISIPLEKAITKVYKKDLEGYLDQTGLFCKQLGEKLKQFMTEGHTPVKTDKPTPKIVTDKW